MGIGGTALEGYPSSVSTSPLGFLAHLVAVGRYIWSHPANQHQRCRAILRGARFQVGARLFRRPAAARLGDHSKIWAVLHRPASTKAMYAHLPDYPEMAAWRRFLGDGDLFVDVGANVGIYSILAAELGAESIAIEPAPDTFALLRSNIELNGYRIRAIPAGAGSAEGQMRFTSGKDCANLVDPQGPAEVQLLTVDSLIGDRMAGGLKVDVEGYEIEVLRGATKALGEKRIRLIQLEWNTTSESAVGTDRRPIAALLSSYGYSLYRPDNSGVLLPISDLNAGPDVFAMPAR